MTFIVTSLQEIIENGCSQEVEDIKNDQWFQCMEVSPLLSVTAFIYCLTLSTLFLLLYFVNF